MGRVLPRPMQVYVDNASAAGISFQKSTCASSKLGGIFDNRVDFIRELKDETAVEAVHADTVKTVADVFTQCLSASVRQCLFKQIDQIAISRATGVLPEM